MSNSQNAQLVHQVTLNLLPKRSQGYETINPLTFRHAHYRFTNSTIPIVKSSLSRNSRSEVLIGKGLLKIFSKFTEEHPCRSAISIKLQNNFFEITLWHGCSPVNLRPIFRTPFYKNTSGWLLLYMSPESKVYLASSQAVTTNIFFVKIVNS